MKISPVKTIYLIAVICGMAYAFVVLQGPNGVPGLLAKRKLVHEYEITNQKMQRELEEKQQRIQRLEANPSEQEFEIRQRLKLARPGEKIYIIDTNKK